MRKSGEIKRIADGIYAQANANINTVASVKADAVNKFQPKTADDLLEFALSIADSIQTVIKSPEVDGVGLPKFLSRISTNGAGLDSVTISVSSKLTAPYKFKSKVSVKLDSDFVVNVGKVYLDALFEMYYIEAAIANVEEVNAVIAGLLKDENIGYTVRFAVEYNSNADVLYISDKEVVLNAAIDKALEANNIGIMRTEEDEFSTLIRTESAEKFVSAMKALQTPAQFIKGNVDVINALTGLPTRKRASKLIRQTYHRQAKYLGAVKAGLGYYDETVTINGEEVNVFAIVRKAEDGTLSVELSPFDVKTQYSVEYDVLAAVAEQTA